MINYKFLAHKIFNNSIKIIKVSTSQYETESKNYKETLDENVVHNNKYDNKSSCVKSFCVLPYSFPTEFASSIICGSLPKSLLLK